MGKVYGMHLQNLSEICTESWVLSKFCSAGNSGECSLITITAQLFPEQRTKGFSSIDSWNAISSPSSL